MVKEQERFDILSTNLSNITDLASPRYKKLSAEMVKSQQMLALLVARNMHCFKVVRIAVDSSLDIVAFTCALAFDSSMVMK